MTYKEIVDKIKPEMDKAIGFLVQEMGKIRTGRASPSLVEDVVVDCFGQKFPLKQLAALSTPEPKQILIQPWDKSYIEGIVASLAKTGVGANAIVDKDVIRINLPFLTEEYRKELARLIAEKQEAAKKTIRHWREDSWSELQTRERAGEIREDDKFRGKDELQKLVDEYNKKADELAEKKKKEISE
ncbi:MAG: ribosome-recycling factor [bacterium]